MRKIAKLFKNGRGQPVGLPSDFRFTSREVFIRKDSETGDVILSRKSPALGTTFSPSSTPSKFSRTSSLHAIAVCPKNAVSPDRYNARSVLCSILIA